MAVGSVVGTLVGSAVSGAASAGIGRLLGGSGGGSGRLRPEQSITGLRAGGLDFRPEAGQIALEGVSPQRQRLLRGVTGEFRGLADTIEDDVLPRVRPGFGELTEARVEGIQSARDRAIGDLRENLARRRVLGSSFAGDALARADAEFGQQEAEARAQSFLQELEMTTNLINQAFDARRSAFQTRLDDLNLQLDVGSGLANQATQQMGANARLKAELAAQAAQGRGQFIGQAFGPFTEALGEAAGGAVSGMF